MRTGKSSFFGTFLASALVVTFASSSARGGEGDPSTKARCAASYETAQVLRRQERLEAAKSELQICRETCPEALARDCTTWLDEVNHLIPTVRWSVRDMEGRRLDGIRASIDGHFVDREVGNASVPVEPGTHVFKFERAGYLPKELRAEFHVGERDRVISVVLAPVPKLQDALVPPPGSPIPSYVVGGIGAAALLTAGALAIKGHVDKGNLRSSCAPECDSGDVDAIRNLWWTAAGVGAAGAVAVGLAVFLWPRGHGQHAGATPAVSVAPRSVALTWTLP